MYKRAGGACLHACSSAQVRLERREDLKKKKESAYESNIRTRGVEPRTANHRQPQISAKKVGGVPTPRPMHSAHYYRVKWSSKTPTDFSEDGNPLESNGILYAAADYFMC
jgi:hypothetical protein